MSWTKPAVGNLGYSTQVPRQQRFWITPRIAQVFEAILAAIATAALYRSLYGELPYHDASRFFNQVIADRFVWDIAHIFMQPVTLLWYRHLGLWYNHLGFGEAVEISQKHINTLAMALGVGIFYALLQRLDVPRWQRVCATLLVMASGSLITLGPSGHMKLLAFPFVNAALYVLVGWERAGTCDGRKSANGVVGGAALLAVAATFLVSALATAPFAALAVLFARVRQGVGWPRGLRSGFLFGAVCGLTFFALACAGYTAFTGLAPSLHGLTGSVTDKADLKPPSYGILMTVARLVFGTVNNLVEAPDLGSVARAWIAGEVPSLAPYQALLISEVGPWLITLALLVGIYARATWVILRGERCLVPAAFLCGAQAWTIYYGLNDPEHWYMLTVPTVILFIIVFPARLVRAVLPIWAILAILVNVVGFAMPYAAYPLMRYETELKTMFSKNDLLISFAEYSGSPSLGVMGLTDVPTVMLDDKLRATPNLATFYADVDKDVVAAFARHGRVVVFGSVLDPYDWNAPWSGLSSRGVAKRQMLDFFYSHYRVRPLDPIAGIPAWEITPRND